MLRYTRRARGFGFIFGFISVGGLVSLFIWQALAHGIAAKDYAPIAFLALLFGGSSAVLIAEFARVRHSYDATGLDYRTPWSRHCRLEWASVERVQWRPAAQWLDLVGSRGKAHHFSTMLAGRQQFARALLARLNPQLLTASPDAAQALAQMAGATCDGLTIPATRSLMRRMSTATVTVLPTAPNTTRIREVFEKQRETALRLRTSTASERVAKLKKLRDAVFGRIDGWYEAAWADFKKPQGEVDLGELLPIAVEINDAISHVAKWMKPHRVPSTLVMAGTSSHIRYEPKGRCLILSPWNYPVNLTFCPLVSAIAAGNTALLKPSEMTPNLSAAMAKLVKDVFTEDEVALFEGDAKVAEALLELPFDHIFFTGSPAIGKVVMAAAAKHLASVTLELGGKSPTIVDESADVDLAAQNVMWGKFANAGQTCIAPDHVYVHAKVKDRFVERCRLELDAAYGKGDEPSPHYARIVNARHTARLKGLLDDAKAKGAKVLAGDRISEKDHFIAPTLLEGAPRDARIMQEEIFGPLLPVIPFTDLGEVIDRINADPKPLALYVYTRDESVAQRVIENTSSGGAVVNHALVQYLHAHLPFGGVNNSGIGNAHGVFGFKAFSHERAVVKAQLKVAKLFKPGQFPEAARKALKKVWKLV